MSVAIINCAEGCVHQSAEDKSKCPCVEEGDATKMECEDAEAVKRLGGKLVGLHCDSSPPHKRDRTVSFEANETPLMFSRSSSLGSLDSVEQHSIHDDYSSVVSDFSQRASGVVSPSELPDSPTHLVSRGSRTRLPDPTDLAAAPEPSNVFDDVTTAFLEEGTPAGHSRGTSLSALTFDKEPRIISDLVLPKGVDEVVTKTDGDPDKERKSNLSEEEEDDEDMLAACISVGMQGCNKNRNPAGDRGGPGACEDAMLTYNTEGTPANLSHAGSRSDLSLLSFSRDGEASIASEGSARPHHDSDDCVSNVSEDCEDMLAECIRSGMPQARAP